MININILTEHENRSLFLYMLDIKRYPKSEYHIVENSDEDIVWDLVVVYEGLEHPHKVRCRKGGLVFISGEPPMSRVYATTFLKQFDTLITQHPKLHHPRNIQSQPCMNWHIGIDYSDNFKSIFSFDELETLQPMKKTRNISMITSAQRMMPGHNRRMNFVEALKRRFGDRIDLYGKGICPVDVKYEALKDYRFSICIENSNISHYWTEKFADPILSYTVPVYFGCTNIHDYFDPRSYIAIDINNTEAALDTLQGILDNAESIYQKYLPYVMEARKKIISDYCIFPTLMNKFAGHLKIRREPVEVTLYPSNTYWQHKWMHRKLRLTRLMYKLRLGGGKSNFADFQQVLALSNSHQACESNTCSCKLSIVVPVYNVEKYVKRCLESILTQDVDKSLYEVIIINDGSTDNSLEIVNKTIVGFANVSVQSSKNFGLSAARNRGTLSAHGEYIWFIDSDDWIEAHSIRTLLPYLDGNNDIVQFGFARAYADGSKKIFHRTPMQGMGRDVLLYGKWPIGAQFSVYRKRGTDNVAQFKFVEGIYHEDNEFTPRILHHASKVVVIDAYIYNHYQGNQNSTMTKPNVKKCFDLLAVSQKHVDYAKTLTDKEVKKFFLTLASLELNTSLTNLRIYNKKEQREYIETVERTKNRYFISLLRSGKLKYRIMALLCLISVRGYFNILLLKGMHVDKKKIETLQGTASAPESK